MVSCSKCGRIFKSQQALAQHTRDAKHTSKPGRRRIGGRVRAPRVPRNGFDINPSRSLPVPGGGVTITGEDRLGIYSVSKGTGTFTSVPIVPGASVRLASICKAYQRVKWLSVSVTVTPQAPMTVAGGYVAGFIMDPDDTAVTAEQLSAAQNSLTRKWFESCTVRMPPKPDLLYTSTSEEPRFSSPGSFWMISEGTPSQDIYVVMTLRWKVHLTTPTVEKDNNYSFSMPGRLIGKQANYNLQWVPESSTKPQDNVYDMMPANIRDQPGDHYFRVPTFNIEYDEGTGDTGTYQAHFIVYRASDKQIYWSDTGFKINTTPVWQSNVSVQTLVPCGTFCKYAGKGNVCQSGLLLQFRSLDLNNTCSPTPPSKEKISKLSKTSRSSSVESFESLKIPLTV